MISIRRITTPQDLQAAFTIRREVFIVGQDVPEAIELDAFDDSAHHILAELDGIPVGTARWRHTTEGAKLERFAVLAAARRRGVGTALVDFILQQIESHTPVYLNSQTEAIPFYSKQGFIAEGPVFYEADIPHRRMVYHPRHPESRS